MTILDVKYSQQANEDLNKNQSPFWRPWEGKRKLLGASEKVLC